MRVQTVKTPVLRLAYEESGPATGEPLILVHGWPDSPRTWDKVLPQLHESGFRTIPPYLRGYGPSTFRNPMFGRSPRRTGQPVAFAQDIIDLADRLRLDRFQFVGHDWGARTGYALAALYPKRVKSLVAISVPFQPGKAEPPNFPQAREFWYQWLLCTKPGEKKFRNDPVAFGRAQWDVWSPPGWYSISELDEAAKSWGAVPFRRLSCMDTVRGGATQNLIRDMRHYRPGLSRLELWQRPNFCCTAQKITAYLPKLPTALKSFSPELIGVCCWKE